MKPHLRTAAVLLLASIGLFAIVPAHAHCTAMEIRLGLIDQADCQIAPEDLIRGYETYKARQQGLKIVEFPKPSPQPRQPDLQVTEIIHVMINQGISVFADVANLGSADAGPFEISTTLEFNRVTSSNTSMEGPSMVSAAQSVAGDPSTRHDMGWFPLPDSYHSYDVTFFVTADSGNAIAELDENNTRIEVCRVLQEERVYPPRDGEIELCPAW